jgi:hypothetical protein
MDTKTAAGSQTKWERQRAEEALLTAAGPLVQRITGCLVKPPAPGASMISTSLLKVFHAFVRLQLSLPRIEPTPA